MRIARILMAAALTALAAMALTATTANAQIEASNETTADHCDLALQNCEIVAHGETTTILEAHTFIGHVVNSECDDEFTGFLHEDGTGHIVNQVLVDEDPDSCTREPCEDIEPHGINEDEWPATLTEPGMNQEVMEVEFCLVNVDTHDEPIHCSLNIAVDNPDHHSVEFSADDVACHHLEGAPFGVLRVEVTGHWEGDSGASDEIEIVHPTG